MTINKMRQINATLPITQTHCFVMSNSRHPLILVLICTMLSLVGCGGGGDAPPSSPPQTLAQSASPSSPPQTPAQPAPPSLPPQTPAQPAPPSLPPQTPAQSGPTTDDGNGNPTPAIPNPYITRNNVSIIDSTNRNSIPAWTSQVDLQTNMPNASVKTGNSTGNMLNLGFVAPTGASSRGYDAIQWQISFLRFEPEAAKTETRYVAAQGTVHDSTGTGHTFYFGINMPNTAQNYPGQARISLFGAEGVPNSSNCGAGADGGAGFSCPVNFVFVQGHTYELVASKQLVSGMPGGYALTGSVRDETTGVLTELGSFGLQNGMVSLDIPIMWAEGTDNAPCTQIGNFAIRLWPMAMYKNSVKTIATPQINSVNCSQVLYKTLADSSTLIAFGPWVTP